MSRILVIFPGWGRSGGARVVGEHINRLVERGHEVHMYSQDECKPDWFDLRCPLVKRRDLRARYDVAIVTNPTTVEMGLLPMGARRFYFVQMAEHMFFPVDSHAYKNALRTYNLAARKGFRFITIAHWLAEFIRGLEVTTPAIIPNGVNPEHFYPDGPAPRDYIVVEGDARNEAKDIAHIGWRVALELRNRYGIKLAGMAAVRHAYAGKLDEFVMDPSLADYRRLYTGAKFLLKASRYEGRSLAPLEAMACGTPICRAIIHGDDDLRHRSNCLRVGYDYDELLAAACEMMENDNLTGMLAHNAARYAAKSLQWDPIINKLEQLLGA